VEAAFEGTGLERNFDIEESHEIRQQYSKKEVGKAPLFIPKVIPEGVSLETP
jgi:hypothetical protein